MDTKDFLERLNEVSMEQFVGEKRLLSFDQYAALFAQRPRYLGRNAAQYLSDTISHYGAEELVRPTGNVVRHRLFDAPFAEGEERLIGQEEVQQDFCEHLSNFVQEGKTSRLLLLHGPNGSAKTSFVQCLARAMVNYSKEEEGAVYTFSWVFPRTSRQTKRLGFSSGGTDELLDPEQSYAFLEKEEIAALIPGEMRDHPIFLIPREQREALLEQLEADGALPDGFRFSDHLANGDLSPGSRRIFDALLAANGGNLAEVLSHVRVERFYFSRRYRRGVVTIQPQMHVDADIRQVTLDESYSTLPAVLRNMSLFQLSGDLVDANRGIIEYSDLLKRPVDAFQYLLGTCENSRITLGGVIAYLDIIFVGTTNDKYVQAFTKMPEFPSFKGRMELVKVPYIRNFRVEQEIYDMQISEEVVGRHIAPHATEMAALWAVLTRLKKPDAERYPESLKSAVAHLTPLEKADLYADGIPPASLRPETARELVHYARNLFCESDEAPDYEGWIGASPREVKQVLLLAGQAKDVACLHPVKVLDEIADLVRLKSLYEFLQLAPSGEYHNAALLLDRVRQRYAAIVDREFKEAMGLVTDDEFRKLLARYAAHASAFLKKETVLDPMTREPVPPDEDFMKDIEEKWAISDKRERVREEFIGKIASWGIDNPGESPDFEVLFRDQFEKLRQSYYKENEVEIARTLKRVIDYIDGAKMQDADRKAAKGVVDAMTLRFGYCEKCVAPAVSLLALSAKTG